MLPSDCVARNFLTADLHGKPITYEFFKHKSGYELFLAMRAFAERIPEFMP
jgi:hypothetical protein